jgi:hypothetical protein
MRANLLVAVVFLAAGSCASPSPGASRARSAGWREATIQGRLHRFTEADADVATTVGSLVHEGELNAAAFLDLQYTSPFTVTIHPDRASMDAQWQALFSDPQYSTLCWMIANGWRSDVSLLSPRVWTSESCGHDGGNTSHVRYVVRHELVHVLQAQHGTIALATRWFAEGLAVYVSGQIDGDYGGTIAAGSPPGYIHRRSRSSGPTPPTTPLPGPWCDTSITRMAEPCCATCWP